MDKASVCLTVFFEDPFWVGVFERVSEGEFSVCKVIFGAPPKDEEIWVFILRYYGELRFSPPMDAEEKVRADSPKRRQRNARKQMQSSGVGTKAQQALQLQREAAKTERRANSRERKEEERQRRFAQKQEKRKEKHKGH